VPTLVPSREAVAVALFNAVSSIAGLRTTGRRLIDFTDVDVTNMPALFVRERPEHYERTQNGMKALPPKRVMWFDVFIYTADPQEGSVLPITQLNDLIDAVEVAMLPDATTGAGSLGGIVSEARINGQILIGDNLTNDGKSIAVIPIEVIRP
jgi:hypothetical protein